MPRLTTRVAGIAGVIFVLLVAVPGFLSGAPPDTGDSPEKFAKYLADNRSALIAAGVIGALADIVVVLFLGRLYVVLRRLGAPTELVVASLIAITITGALADVGGLVQAGAAFRFNHAPGGTVDPRVAQLAVDIASMAFAFLSFTIAAFFLTTAGMFASARLFPAWLAWLGVVAALLAIIGGFSAFGTSGFYSLEGGAGLVTGLAPLAVFMLATSIFLIVRAGAIDAGATDGGATVRPVPASA